ncbi:GNAT family N-acetyltransferase [Streptomyces sp. WAC05374]|uniref:GNAT family N-acetyltransferase n=1 Tax=Streptomyces sp. WAC05374 TaxID=2487420 RepID=UPI000F87FCBD|nr:GNAT family N-acetyltransferase [Streptomyces sp. WAC05374]RST17100.1 GNAT family N-acetyltransferase [Streptomyces sp. WAC05374]TDF47344.1 GNAT family N-acetyltransferase [Streptomyces sp. WAC05374]TDF57602.1 GNAT family N-acetyltransferase [Streptomyces sp. WAC05374]TDF61707.1 GNAT family N-acetyltransferase [Streptomyces sp. WAC05374]
MSVDVRTVTASEFPDWLRARRTGFMQPPVVPDDEVRQRLPYVDLGRTQGAFDNGRCVATFRSFAQELTVPGGARLVASAVSNVTVSPTHRRRGLLSRMMAADLAAAKERGEAVSTLIAAEYPIYGRYGYGPATWTTEWTVDVRRAGLDPRWSGPGDGGRVDLVDGEEIRKLGPDVHDRLRAVRHGVVSRDQRVWDVATGAARLPDQPWSEPFYATYRSAAGELEGYVCYAADDTWEAKRPECRGTVRELLALTPAAERALWRFVCSVDWMTTVTTGLRAPDDLLPLLLPDPRAALVTTHADFLWVRIVDAVRALEARTYAGSGRLVLELRDAAGLAGGRFRLDASPEGASCAPTTASPDLAMDVAELGTLYLGDESVSRLVELGRVEEAAPGAAAVADVLLRTARRPWCPDIF